MSANKTRRQPTLCQGARGGYFPFTHSFLARLAVQMQYLPAIFKFREFIHPCQGETVEFSSNS